MAKFYAYLEDFHEITVIVPHTYRKDNIKRFYAEGNDETISLEIVSHTRIGDECKYVLRFDGYILLNSTYYIFDDREEQTELYTGKIVRRELFDDIYYYDDDDLGHTYHKNSTTFKLWTPVAKYIKIELTSPDNDTRVVDLEYHNTGIWSTTLEGNYEGYRYRYITYVNGKEHKVRDPYAISSTANGTHSYVINPQRLYKRKYARPEFSGIPTDAIIYETSVRDFTMDNTIQATYKGQYLGLVEKELKTPQGNPAGFDYLKQLGITHVQLMPIYDFETVDELHPEKSYNWGYDPMQYNVPEGSFSTDPNDPYKRLNELKRMIDKLHKHGLRVIMDVVYNHVYEVNTFPFEKIIPGYAFRVDSQGILTNASGCGNDVATERKMIRKFIIDSVLYWAKHFKIDGFRFDLMGLIDVKTMNMLRQKLELYRKDIIVHGEGWKMPTNLKEDETAHMYNKNVLFNIGHFNDTTRETIKGTTFTLKEKGYAMGDNLHNEKVNSIILGSCGEKNLFRYPSQSTNYVECHDNNTFYDKAKVALKEKDESTILKAQKLATSMMILSQGVPFIHSGQEFYRSKNGVENSYKSSDEINKIRWHLVDDHLSDIQDFKTLLEIRKTYSVLRLTNASKIKKYTHVRFTEHGTAIYELNRKDTHLIIVFKNNQASESITLEDAFEVLYDSNHTLKENVQALTLNNIGTLILKATRKAE